MKRYKDCALVCNKEQNTMDLLDLIEEVSKKKEYKVERYSTWNKNDSLGIYTQEKGLPYSRLILTLNNEASSVDVVNIVPTQESGISQIGYAEYNKLLDIYCDDVFAEIKRRYGNVIKENTEDYSIEDIIPLSYKSLDEWLQAYPLSGHPLDTERWYRFVVKLHLSGEHLPISDFEEYIREAYNWAEDDISRFSLKLESHLDLLEYYDNNKLTIC
jgi:hypothetical protein|nr:hypothetical protein [uncultured Porphyromonas sp.]